MRAALPLLVLAGLTGCVEIDPNYVERADQAEGTDTDPDGTSTDGGETGTASGAEGSTEGTAEGSTGSSSETTDGESTSDETDAGETGDMPDHRVFVTSSSHAGDFGALTNADQICQDVAQAAALDGTYKAIVSVTGESALSRVEIIGPVWNMADEVVADSAFELWSGALQHAVGYDENGDPVSASVWTGTEINGTDSTADCMDWTGVANGAIGQSDAMDGTWLLAGYDMCPVQLRLYCMSQ